METYLYQVKNHEELADDLFELVVEPDGPALPYLAGQYVEILYPDGNYYPFSIANAPQGNGDLVFYIRLSFDDLPLQGFLLSLEETHEIHLRGPFGDCFYRDDGDSEIILLAGGTGIAPMKALVDSFDDMSSVNLFWGVKSPNELFLHDYFLTLQHIEKIQHYVPVVSGHEPWGGASGWVFETVLDYFPDLSNAVVYASGPYEMIMQAKELYERYGLDANHFYTDIV